MVLFTISVFVYRIFVMTLVWSCFLPLEVFAKKEKEMQWYRVSNNVFHMFFTLVLVRSRTLYQKNNLQKSLDRPLNASNCIHNGAYCVKKLRNLSYVYSYWYIRTSYNKSGNRKSIINLSYSKSSVFFNFSFSLVTYSLLTHLLPM